MDSHQKVPGGSIYSRELQQRWRRRLRKRQLKSVFARVQTSSRLFHLVQLVKCWRICLEVDSKGLYQSSEKAKEGRCSRPPKTREIRQFHVVVAQRRQGNAQKRVMDVQGCCFANLNLLGFFCRSRCRRPRRCLSSLVSPERLEDKANDATFTMRCLFYWTSVFQAQ